MKLKPTYQVLILVSIALSVYYPTLFVPFNSLDDQTMVNLLLNQQGFALSRHFSPGGTYDYYRPLLTLTFELDKYVGGLQEAFMHLVNVLVHTANVVLIWLFARYFSRFVNRSSDLLPFLAAVLFCVHPINAEAVNWFMGRTDLMAGTFVFVCAICLLRFIETRSLIWGGVGALTLLLGALCKETALFLVPGACFLLFCRPLPGLPDWRLRWTLPVLYGTAVAGYFALRWGSFHTDRGLEHTAQFLAHAAGLPSGSTAIAADPFPWLDAVRVILKVSGFYAVKLVQPLPLNFAIHRVDDIYLLPGVVLTATLFALAWRRRPTEWLFLASASVAISSLFVIFTRLAWTPIAERYMYIPCGFFAVGLVFAMGEVFKALSLQRAALILMPLLFGGAAWATASRNLIWQDNLTLYQDTVQKSPDFAPAKNQLALALIDHGLQEEAQAIMAENVMPAGGAATVNEAVAHWERKDYNSAREILLDRLQNPRAPKLQILEMLVQMTSAQVLRIDDKNLKRSHYLDILTWLNQILSQSPDGFVHYRIGRVHLILNNRSEAQYAFSEAARLLPADSVYKQPAVKLSEKLTQ